MKRIRTSAPRIRRERRWPEDLPADPRDPDVVGADIIAEVASEHGASAAQVRLAWTLHRGPNILAIPGTVDPAHLRENVAADGLHLTDLNMSPLGHDPVNHSFRQDEQGGRDTPGLPRVIVPRDFRAPSDYRCSVSRQSRNGNCNAKSAHG